MNRIRHNMAARRAGFTLIEILVVIAIIAILASLLLAGVMVFLRKGPEVQTRNDILQLAQGLQKFKATYGQYPPSLFRVRARLADYSGGDALDRASASFLSSVMFKNLPTNASIPWAGYQNGNPNTPVAIPAQGIILEGDQCLMFFLCGPPAQGGNVSAGFFGGFSNNPQNPMDPTSMATPIRFIEFPNTGRLTIRQNSGPNPAGVAQLFPSYLDPYGVAPFMYFSAGNRPNGYQQSANSLGASPYLKNAGQFHNSDSYQLMSAGADQSFGPGGLWPPPAGGFGADDLTNLTDLKMGAQ